MTEQQFDSFTSIFMEQTQILKDIRGELQQMNVRDNAKQHYWMVMDPAKASEDFQPKGKKFDPETSPKCPTHSIFLEKDASGFHCPFVGCNYIESHRHE